jgi:hypothetical protein
MHVSRLQHVCGHRQEWLMPCGYQAAYIFMAALAREICPRCHARSPAVARNPMAEYHRLFCAREQPPGTAAIHIPPPRRRAS